MGLYVDDKYTKCIRLYKVGWDIKSWTWYQMKFIWFEQLVLGHDDQRLIVGEVGKRQLAGDLPWPTINTTILQGNKHPVFFSTI